ncbi:MAG: DUF308 domain-containing protein [Acutalibacteraceae bacterium]|nr:DUF308 domain-containing protein [Acutalibacteraceae bacterium]
MKKLKRKLPDNIFNVIVGGVLAIVGLFVLLFPSKSLMTVCYVLGTACLIGGTIRTVRYVKDKKESTPNIIDIISGIVLLSVAFMLLLHPKFLMSVLPFIIGISVVVYGISSFFTGRGGLFSKIFAGITAIYGVSLVLNPFKGATSITSMVGFGLFIFGIVKIVSEIVLKKRKPQLPEDIDGDGYIEVDFKDI